MAQKAVELILMRQLASYLAVPIFMFDPDGNLLFYNEPAEALVGRRFDETGEMPLDDWYQLMTLTEEDGSPVPREARPLVIALKNRQAAHRRYVLHAADGVARRIEVTAFPLEGQGGHFLGAVAICWEAGQP
jgi:PAS domain-containing protein